MKPDISVLEELKSIYSDVSEWLKFAETKHAVAFSLWTALIIAMLSSDGYWALDIVVQAILVIPLLIGALLNLMAFIPFLNRNKYIKSICYKKYAKKNFSDNVVYYQSIFVISYTHDNDIKKSAKKYRKQLEKVFESSFESALLDTYIIQIIETATVATIKVYLFDIVGKYLGVLLLIVILMIVVA